MSRMGVHWPRAARRSRTGIRLAAEARLHAPASLRQVLLEVPQGQAQLRECDLDLRAPVAEDGPPQPLIG